MAYLSVERQIVSYEDNYNMFRSHYYPIFHVFIHMIH